MRDPQTWSLARRLNSRILLVTVLITLFVSSAVAVHYGYDVPELRQRTVFDLTRAIASDLPADQSRAALEASVNDKHHIFTQYPEAYEWANLDAKGETIATSADGDAIDRARFPPGLPPDEWAAPCSHGGWEAGKTFVIGGEIRHIVAVAHSDPAGLLTGLILGEVAMHILLPLAPFALLITLVTSGIIASTLKPLESLASQAVRVRDLEDIRPLDPKGAPVEVAELVNALNTALEGLRTSITKEKDFLLDASHALRTPLAIIKARLELDGDEIDRGQLSEEVEALIRLTSQLLASANAERLVIEPGACADLNALAREAVSSMTPLAIRSGIDLGYSEDAAGMAIRGDSDAISHALKNLIENALKFTPRGKTVTVHVGHAPPSLTISDEGPGVEAGQREKIFERYSRARFGNGSGAGLGLSIARRIMIAHSGSIDLVSARDGGAAFKMTFPTSSN